VYIKEYKRVKRQFMDGRQYLQILDLLRSSYPNYIKNSSNSTNQNSVNKWAKDLNKHFSKEDINK
jgi:hypothetical protein